MKPYESSRPPSTPPVKAGTNRVRVFFNGFAVGVLCAGAVAWYWHYQAKNHPAAQERFEQAAANAASAAGETVYLAGEALRSKLETLDLKPDQIIEEMSATGKVVRRRARVLADQVTDVASDTYVTTAVATKITADRDLSIRRISVTTKEGHVTLDGTVASAEQVGKAVALALGTDGVRDVTANLKVAEKP